MIKIPSEKIEHIVNESKARALSLWKPLWAKLTFNLAEGVLAPQKTLSVSIEKGGLSIVYGSRFLSKIRMPEQSPALHGAGRNLTKRISPAYSLRHRITLKHRARKHHRFVSLLAKGAPDSGSP